METKLFVNLDFIADESANITDREDDMSFGGEGGRYSTEFYPQLSPSQHMGGSQHHQGMPGENDDENDVLEIKHLNQASVPKALQGNLVLN